MSLIRIIALCLAGLVLLAGCEPKSTLLEKPAPEAVTDQSLIHPPWEALVKAGPGAAKDIDLETLNGPNPHPLLAGGAVASPADATQPPQPQPEVAKPPQPPAADATAIKAVAVLPVTGASPQGNQELTAALRKVLREAGWPVLDKPRKDALSIQGRVQLEPASGPQQTVKLDWQVASPKGKDLGHVAQANQVPAHSLDQGWGETATYATQAAADGLFKLIGQYR